MRIPIREQLTAFALFATLVALAVVAIATWITNHNFVLHIRASRLTLTASLKAGQLSSNLALMETTVRSLTTRVKIQSALQNYISGNQSADNWVQASSDLWNGISNAQQTVLTYQAMLFPAQTTTRQAYGVANVTNPEVSIIRLPYGPVSNNSAVHFGDTGLGFPPCLYPNITYQSSDNTSTPYFNSQELNSGSSLLLGPWQINQTLSLLSITLPIINDTGATNLLGWLTVIFDTRLLVDTVASPVGLDETGVVLLLGPVSNVNRFNGTPPDMAPPFPSYSQIVSQDDVQVVLSGYLVNNPNARRDSIAPFRVSSYPAVLNALTQVEPTPNNAASVVDTYNENGVKVGVGYAVPSTNLCDWLLVFEEAHEEVFEPIAHLRNVLLACVFITAAVMILITWPLAHLSVRPIRRLKAATAQSIEPPGLESSEKFSVVSLAMSEGDDERSEVFQDKTDTASRSFLLAPLTFLRKRQLHLTAKKPGNTRVTRKAFRIPAKVKVSSRICVQDELTELTETFNEMSEELSLHYHRLEERVRQRTAELETSKKAAEAANESKTLFIANLSHELKSPLNAILGLAAVCMQEHDLEKVQQSLRMIYNSGDLLHNLLTDLLTFSKNEVGHQICLEERDFSLRDIPSQMKAIFENQARESGIKLTFAFEGVADSFGNSNAAASSRIYGPPGTGKVKDMQVYGDKHRILQVAINLLSNALKFTPQGGSVSMRIRCLQERGDVANAPLRGESLTVTHSETNHSSSHIKKVRYEKSPIIAIDTYTMEGAASCSNKSEVDNERDIVRRCDSLTQSIESEYTDCARSAPPNSKILMFEFEVEDTGPGIPSHLHKSIFDPFMQGDLRLTKRYGGAGLGLAIVSQLAKLMRGTISVKSEVGVGSTFKLQIPLTWNRYRRGSQATSIIDGGSVNSNFFSRSSIVEDNSNSRLESTSINAANGPSSKEILSAAFDTDKKPRLIGLSQPYFSTVTTPPLSSPGTDSSGNRPKRPKSTVKVLVAEDNTINQEVVLRMLRLEDIFDVHIAKDGQEALEKVKMSMEVNEPYEIIFMDVQMPRLDGRQSTRAIRKIGYSAPIVALTAFSDESNQKECMESGMNYFLAKPIRRPALRKVLKTFCSPIAEVVTDNSLEYVAKLPSEGKTPESEDAPDETQIKSSEDLSVAILEETEGADAASMLECGS